MTRSTAEVPSSCSIALHVAASELTWAETIPGGGYATKRLARGSTLRLTEDTTETTGG